MLVPPVPFGKWPEAPLFDEFRQSLLYCFIGRFAVSPCHDTRHRSPFLRFGDRFGRIGFERFGDIDPVERMKVIEMDDVVVDVKRALNQVPHQTGVFGNGHAERMFDRLDGALVMGPRTDAADPHCQQAAVARVTSFEDLLDSPEHR